MLRRIFFSRQFLTKALIFWIVIGLLIGAYFLLDEEDFIADEPWPGVVYRSQDRNFETIKSGSSGLNEDNIEIVTLAVVACKGRMDEALTMLKSAVIFSKHVHLNIIAVADRRSQLKFSQEIEKLRIAAQSIGVSIEYEVYASWFPVKNRRVWRRMWLPCSSQRLFFPTMFNHLDSLMYIDTDVYFVSDLVHLWDHFSLMNSEQLAAMAPEHELPGDGWYNLLSKIPYYGERGLNAGIMLMNLTRMRTIGLEERAATILETYGNELMWADQDILNVLFHFYPEYLYELNCAYNFRAQHCKCDYPGESCECKSAKENGAAVIHGNRARFHYYADSTLEFLRDFYKDFSEYALRTNAPENLYDSLLMSYDRIEKEPCGMSGKALLSNFKNYVNKYEPELRQILSSKI